MFSKKTIKYYNAVLTKVIIDFTAKHGWNLLKTKKNLIELNRGIDFLEVQIKGINSFEVKTIMDHPVQGFNELTRKKLDLEELMRVIKNPRYHTGKGN